MPIRPSIRLSTLPAASSFVERFRLARQAGFEGIELEANSGPSAAIREAAERTNMVVHSVHCLANYAFPLSSADPAVLSAGIRATIEAIELARTLGAETMLLVPGVVASDVSYGEVHARSQEAITRHILPIAADRGIILAIENVWNGFLLSPIDYAQYVDSFGSPWVRAYLDVGNIVFGRPEGWIDILGHRICKLHLKDISYRLRFGRGRFDAAKIGAGDIDWTKVRAALDRVGFAGWGVLAEPDQAQPVILGMAYGRLIRQQTPRSLAALGGPLRAVQTQWARRLLKDVMKRFRRHVAC